MLSKECTLACPQLSHMSHASKVLWREPSSSSWLDESKTPEVRCQWLVSAKAAEQNMHAWSWSWYMICMPSWSQWTTRTIYAINALHMHCNNYLAKHICQATPLLTQSICSWRTWGCSIAGSSPDQNWFCENNLSVCWSVYKPAQVCMHCKHGQSGRRYATALDQTCLFLCSHPKFQVAKSQQLWTRLPQVGKNASNVGGQSWAGQCVSIHDQSGIHKYNVWACYILNAMKLHCMIMAPKHLYDWSLGPLKQIVPKHLPKPKVPHQTQSHLWWPSIKLLHVIVPQESVEICNHFIRLGRILELRLIANLQGWCVCGFSGFNKPQRVLLQECQSRQKCWWLICIWHGKRFGQFGLGSAHWQRRCRLSLVDQRLHMVSLLLHGGHVGLHLPKEDSLQTLGPVNTIITN